MQENYDIIIVGAGHAGCEVSLIAALMGMNTLLITMDLDRIGYMSCNPAIGGLAKGHLVREIDALGGAMAKAIDATGIHFKMLGTSRGPAVHGPRAQADKNSYSRFMKKTVENTAGLSLRQERVEQILVNNEKVQGVRGASGIVYGAKAVILTTGTFLNGLVHIGLKNYSGGRAAEPGSKGISKCLADLGFSLDRLKTGTPPRIDGKTIDYNVCEEQTADRPPRPFSFETKSIDRDQIDCHITYTNPKTHEIIRSNLDRSPLYTGVIQGVGPRYCPSIEDKVMKFPDRDRHQIFLEPEGIDTIEVYANGVSTSLPPDTQIQYIRSIAGLEQAKIMRFGYGIEYDFVLPSGQIKRTLETQRIEGLFLAGQINGTTGYEEAAAQGLLAGINAACKLQNKKPIILGRNQAYIGVLLDDLIIRSPIEPYRMFTSRAEHRLLLRQDNADRRLSSLAYELGAISEKRYRKVEEKEKQIEILTKELWQWKQGNQPLAKILRRPEIKWPELVELDNRLKKWENKEVIEQVEIEIKYEGYLKRQEKEVERFHKMENFAIPHDVDYQNVIHLKKESREKLSLHRPASLGQASRINGVSPADISVLMVYLNGEYRTKRNS